MLKEVLGWTKEQVWGKLLYVYGYDINWWKDDGKCWLLMCLQNQKKKKRDTKVSYIVKRRKKHQKNAIQRNT